MKPWEKYQQAEKSGPWERYQKADADPAKVIEVDPTEFKGRESYGEPEKVSVADWLEKNHDVKFEDGVRDYEGKAKAFGLSGDAKGDFEALKHREATLNARRMKSLNPVFGGSPEAKASLTKMGRETEEFISKAPRTAAASLARSGFSTAEGAFRGTGEVYMRYTPNGWLFNKLGLDLRDATEPVAQWLSEAGEISGDVYGEDPYFRESLFGQTIQGAASLAPLAASGGAGGVAAGARGAKLAFGAAAGGLYFNEGISEAEGTIGKKFEDFSEDEKSGAVLTSAAYAVVAGAVDRYAFGKMGLGKLIGGKDAQVGKGFIKRTIEGAISEGGAEWTQGRTLKQFADWFQEQDREVWTMDALKESWRDFLIGAIVGGGVGGGSAVMDTLVAESEAGMKAEIEAYTNRQVPFTDSGEYNPFYRPEPLFDKNGNADATVLELSKQIRGLGDSEKDQVEKSELEEKLSARLQELEETRVDPTRRDAAQLRRFNVKLAMGINPTEGATPADWRFINEFYSDEETADHVKQFGGSDDLATLAIEAKHGDTSAQEEYVNRTLVPADSEILVEDGVTPEEAEAMRETEANEDPEKRRNLTTEELRNEAFEWAKDFRGARLLEGQSIEDLTDQSISFEDDLNILRDQGVPEWQIEKFAFGAIQAAGYDPTDSEISPSKMAIKGRNEDQFRRGVWRDVSKLFRGADPLTVFHEVSEGNLKREIAEGSLDWNTVAIWREMMGDGPNPGQVDLENPAEQRNLIEWTSSQVEAWLVGKTKVMEREGQMPDTFRGWLAKVFTEIKHIFKRAAQLKGMDRRGELDPEFKAFLERSNGLDENFLRDRLERPAEMESVSDVEIELLEAMPLNRLPRPDMEPEFRGELEQIFEAFGKNWKSYPKNKTTLDDVMLALQEEGFEVQTPKDVIDAYTAVSRGERVVNATNFTDSTSYSMGLMGGGLQTFKSGDTVIDFGISRDGETGEVILVKTPKGKRGQGSARKALQEFLANADREGITMFLTAEPMDKGVTKSGLEKFYKSLGFKKNTGKNKDFRSTKAWVREPQNTGATYSMGRSTVIPNADTQTFPTKDGGLIGPATYSLKAFHGTPHKVDKFKTENIGTGEGAQAYGWGLYFAESEEVARNYRDQLGKRRPATYKVSDGREFDGMSPEALYVQALIDGRLNEQIEALEGAELTSDPDYAVAKSLVGKSAKVVEGEATGGSLYTVELNVEQDELLDWDAPLSEQPEKVREALEGMDLDETAKADTGRDYYFSAARAERSATGKPFMESGKPVSSYLASLGIKGIRYLDGASRQFSDDALRGLRKAENYLSKLESQYKENPSDSLADGIEDAKQKLQSARRAVGDLSYNYVIFNDADITITEENGEPVSLATYSMGRITETPEFKRWFGDSKVVDSNGDPLVVYHGTPDANFDYFKEASHFTEDPNYAANYLNPSASSMGKAGVSRESAPAIYPVYLSIKNPFNPRDNSEHRKLYEEFTFSYGNGTPLSDQGLPDWTDSLNLLEWIEETGQPFDGLMLDEGGTPEGGHRGVSWVPVSPTQIKSATGNRGTFDPNDPRITYSMGRISDLGGDPNETTAVRERTPEERLLAQKLREFRTDEWLTQAQKNRINKTPADGRAKLRTEFEKDFKRELKVLQTKATESRKRQRLQASAMKKIAKGEARRLEQIKILHDQGEDVTAKLEELDRIKKGLPTAVRHRLGGEVQVSRRKTRMGRQNEVNRRLVRARELAEGHEATRRKAWLRRTLKRYGTQSGPKLQNLSKEVTKDVRDRLRVALYAAHQDRPEETIERMAKPEGMDQQVFEDTARDFVGLLQPQNRDYGRIEAAYFAVQDLIRDGKYSMDQFRDQRKARLDELALTSTRQALQGNPLLNDSEIAQQEEASGAKGKAGRWLSNAMSGYTDGFENIIRRIDGEQEGPIWRELYADPVDGIAASQDRVNIYVADAADMLLDGMATAFPDLVTKKGDPDVSAITKRLTEWERHPKKGERTGIEMSDREGGEVTDRPLSIAEAITVKLLLRQEGSHPTFRIIYGVKDISAFEKTVDAYIGADGLAFVEHVVSPFYDGAFNQLNEVFLRVEGHEMDPVKDYFPFLREIASENVEDAGNPFAPFEESGSPDGVEKGSLKTRSEMVTLPFRFQSVTSVLQNSVRTNANYIGKAGLEKKFRRLTTDPNFKRALKQRFGAKAIKQFVDAANVFTAGRMQQSGWGGWLDAARSRMITGVLAAKPKIMFTQLTSIPAGAVDMPVTEWVSGVAQIMRSPEKHFRELLATPQMKHRITQAQAQETITSLNKLQNLGLGAGWGARMEQAIKYSMILIKVGDVAGASLSAGPIYFRAKARELKAGKSESQAKQTASHEFAMAVNRSQQSPHLHSRPQTYQKSEFLRALYAFRSAPIQYQSEVNRAISEFVRTSLDGNQSTAKRWEVAKQSGKAFFVYHILLPQLFYALNNALTGFWLDDDERVLDYWKGAGLTLLMGNFSAIPVAGDTIYSGAAKLTDTSSFSPTVAPIGAEQIARIPGWMDHLISGTGEQRVKAASRMANFTGLPAETITKQAQSFSELLEDDDPTKFLELMGWSEFIFGNQ